MAEIKSSHGDGKVIGTAMSRTGPGLVRLDVGDKEAMRAFIKTQAARWVHVVSIGCCSHGYYCTSFVQYSII